MKFLEYIIIFYSVHNKHETKSLMFTRFIHNKVFKNIIPTFLIFFSHPEKFIYTFKITLYLCISLYVSLDCIISLTKSNFIKENSMLSF